MGVSVEGYVHVLRKVGTNDARSMPTAITIESVGSLVNSQGIRPASAMARNILSALVMPLKPYLSEKRKMMTVKISDAATGRAPIPAPLASMPKKTVPETMAPTNHVYG